MSLISCAESKINGLRVVSLRKVCRLVKEETKEGRAKGEGRFEK